MKCGPRRYPYTIVVYKTSVNGAARQRRPTQVAERLGMGKRGLLKRVRCGVLSPLTFTDNSDVYYFDQVWLRKATGIVEGRRGNVD